MRLSVHVRFADPIELDTQRVAVVVQVVGGQLHRAFAAAGLAFDPAVFTAGDLGAVKVLRCGSFGRCFDRIEVQLNFFGHGDSLAAISRQ